MIINNILEDHVLVPKTKPVRTPMSHAIAIKLTTNGHLMKDSSLNRTHLASRTCISCSRRTWMMNRQVESHLDHWNVLKQVSI